MTGERSIAVEGSDILGALPLGFAERQGQQLEEEVAPANLPARAHSCNIRLRFRQAAFCVVPWGLVMVRFLSKAVLTYYGAKTFVEKNEQFFDKLLWLSLLVQWGMPLIDGIQSYFLSGSSGRKNVQVLMRSPNEEFRALGRFMCKHPFISLIVSSRIIGDAVLNGMVMSSSFADIPGLTDTTATALAILCAGINGFADIKFSGSGDIRLLKKLSCQKTAVLKKTPDEQNLIMQYLGAYAGEHDNLADVLNDLDACRQIRGYARSKAFRQRYNALNDIEGEQTTAQRWQFSRLQTQLISGVSTYDCGTTWAARVTTLMVTLPFIYLRYLKNKEFGEQHFGLAWIAVAWAITQVVLKLMTSQGRPVEGLADSLDGADRTVHKKMWQAMKTKPLAALFCIFGVLPFSVFGVGQLLDMHEKIDFIDADTMAGITKGLIAVFMLAQVLSYVGFIGARVYKKMPTCCRRSVPQGEGYQPLLNPVVTPGVGDDIAYRAAEEGRAGMPVDQSVGADRGEDGRDDQATARLAP